MTQDGFATEAVEFNRNMLVPWYLMASYGYYIRDESLLRDSTFDTFCRELDRHWDFVEHRHKHIIDRASLAAGTCLLGRGDYPLIVKGAACRLLGIELQDTDFLAVGLKARIGMLERELSLLSDALKSR